jgi:NADH:ubiquinone oxidoreductase subunit B-like Fe-S oxidoreductase
LIFQISLSGIYTLSWQCVSKTPAQCPVDLSGCLPGPGIGFVICSQKSSPTQKNDANTKQQNKQRYRKNIFEYISDTQSGNG